MYIRGAAESSISEGGTSEGQARRHAEDGYALLAPSRGTGARRPPTASAGSKVATAGNMINVVVMIIIIINNDNNKYVHVYIYIYI